MTGQPERAESKASPLCYFDENPFKRVIKMQPKWHAVKQLSALNSPAAQTHQSPDLNGKRHVPPEDIELDVENKKKG